jgi:hypothetical protein
VGSKRVLWEATKDLLPSALIDEPKRGFSLPYVAWMKGPLAHHVARLAEPHDNLGGLVDGSSIRTWSRLLTTRRNERFAFPMLWALMVLQGMLMNHAPCRRFQPFSALGDA